VLRRSILTVERFAEVEARAANQGRWDILVQWNEGRMSIQVP